MEDLGDCVREKIGHSLRDNCFLEEGSYQKYLGGSGTGKFCRRFLIGF